MKRISTLLLAVLLIVSMLLMASCDTEPETTTTTTTTPASTTTTTRPPSSTRPPLRPTNPVSQKSYEVGTKDELIELAQKMLDNNWMQDGIEIKLTADIYLNDVSDPEWYNGTGLTEWPWAGLKQNEQPFEGTIDGQGHTIYGLYADVDATVGSTYLVALVPQATGRTVIKNLALRNGYLKATSNQAYYYDAEHMQNNKTGYFANGGTYLSSFVAYCNASELTVENCYSDITLRAVNNSPASAWGGPTLRAGGLVGFCHNASGVYKLNNLAFYGEIIGSTGTYLKDQNGTIVTQETGNASGIHAGALMIGNQNWYIAVQVTNTVVAPKAITGFAGVGAFLEESFNGGTSNTPKLQNVYTSVALFHGSSTKLQQYIVTYYDDWSEENIETCKANMTATDFENRSLLNLYGQDFTWYTSGAFSSTNCWTYDANGQLIQQIFLPQA